VFLSEKKNAKIVNELNGATGGINKGLLLVVRLRI
jgi:hypothetical protein